MDDKYAAGFFDGEGTVSIGETRSRRGYTRTSLRVCIANTHEQVINALHQKYGGYIKRLKGCKRPVFMLTLATLNAVAFLEAVLPHVIVKRRQVELALEYWAFTHQPKELRFEKLSHKGNFGGGTYRRRPEVNQREREFITTLKAFNHDHAPVN